MAEQPELNTARQSVTRNIYIYIYKCVLLKSEGRGIVDNTTERYAPVEKDDRTLVWDGRGSCRVILYVCVCVCECYIITYTFCYSSGTPTLLEAEWIRSPHVLGAQHDVRARPPTRYKRKKKREKKAFIIIL